MHTPPQIMFNIEKPKKPWLDHQEIEGSLDNKKIISYPVSGPESILKSRTY